VELVYLEVAELRGREVSSGFGIFVGFAAEADVLYRLRLLGYRNCLAYGERRQEGHSRMTLAATAMAARDLMKDELGVRLLTSPNWTSADVQEVQSEA
jgi:hypothetical protein